MAYRNELVAAQSRGHALEREVGELRRKLSEQEGDSNAPGWSRLMDRGANEKTRMRAAAMREKNKSARKAKRNAISEKRWELRKEKFQRFDQRRRYIRSSSRLGRYAHWFAPLLIFSPFLCLFMLYILMPAVRGAFHSIALASVAIWGLSNLWARLMAAREATRSAKLPFTVYGHHETLGMEFRDIQMCLAFEGSAPTKGQMKQWLMGLATEVRGRALRRSIRNTAVQLENNEFIVSPKDLVTAWMAGNRSYFVWYRQVVEKALVELHEAFPLRRVRIEIVK